MLSRTTAGGSDASPLSEEIRRAYTEFLRLPSWIILGFLLLAVGASILDHARMEALEPLHRLLRRQMFSDSQATGQLLGAVAGSLITVTSITFSVLLLAVQQAAASLSHQVVDQFLRRTTNQVFFGFFLGVALFALRGARE